MKHLRTIIIFFVAIQIIESEAYAQKLGDTLSIEEIRISSGRPFKHNSLTLTRLDSLSVQNKSSSSLSELLTEHSGIFIKSYGRGAMASASFRGTDPSHTKVLWNGIELNSPMLGMVDFSLISVFFVDKVELLHGSSSLSETSGALGGLISLNTEPDWNSHFSGSYLQGAGSFGTHDEHLRFNFGSNKLQSQTRIFYAHSNNDFSFENHDIIDSVDLETGQKYYPRMKNEDAWFSYYGFLQELHYRPGKNDILSMSFWGQESSRSIPLLSSSESGPNCNINRQEDNSIRGQISYRHYGDRFNLKVFSGLNTMDLSYVLKNRLPDESFLLAIDSKSKTSSLYNKLDLQYLASSGLRMEFSAGVDYHRVESLEKVKIMGYMETRIQSHFSGSLYKTWDKRWNSNIKFGTELIGRDYAGPIFQSGTEFHILPDDKFYLKLLFASNTKYPSLNDLYYQPGGNIHLKPERSYDQEFGVHYSIAKGDLKLNHDFSAYMSQVKNWIMWYYTVKGFSPANIEKVDIKGFETNASISYSTEKALIKLSSGYSMTRSRDMGRSMNEFDLSFGKQLPYIPVHSANTMIYLIRDNWSLTYIWNYYSKRNTTSSSQEGSQGDYLYPYFMNQAGIGKQVQMGNFRLDLNLKVHNLFNEQYRSILQRPMPGRNFNLQVKLSF
jgi:iron complex outermembrane receptor protein